MKKFTAILLAMAMITAFVSCGKNDKTEENGSVTLKNVTEEFSAEDLPSENVTAHDSDAPSSFEDETKTSATVSAKTEPATKHVHQYTQTLTPATCTQKGFTTFVCECGDTYKDNFTNPSHSFKNGVCSACGETDDSQAYRTVANLVKENGSKSGGTYSYCTYNTSDNVTSFYLCYTEATDRLYISMDMMLYTPGDHCELDLKPVNGKYKFSADILSDSGASIHTTGYIKNTFSDDDSAVLETYSGNASEKELIAEIASLMISNMLVYTSKAIKNDAAFSVDLSDLGLVNYSVL